MIEKKTIKWIFGGLIFLSVNVYSQSNIDQAYDQQKNANQEMRGLQEQVNQLSETSQAYLEDYTQTLRRKEALRIYNQQLERHIESQQKEIVSIKEQIDRVEETSQGIIPLLISMTKNLEDFVSLDTPFLLDQRKSDVQELFSLLDRADVTVSEKYRRVLESYQKEAQYGRTLEAYRGVLSDNGRELTVDFLRVGRLSLVYQTLDGSEQGFWDSSKVEWVKLPRSYRRDISQAIRVARQQVAPDLINIPLLAPVQL